MNYVVENWFDYEMSENKYSVKLLESLFDSEYNNTMQILEAIDVISESSIADITSINEGAIIDKIKELWEKFKAWLGEIKDKLFSAKGRTDELTKKALATAGHFDESASILNEAEDDEEPSDENGGSATLHYYKIVLTKPGDSNETSIEFPSDGALWPFQKLQEVIVESLHDFKKLQTTVTDGWDEFQKPLIDLREVIDKWDIVKDDKSFGVGYGIKANGKRVYKLGYWVDSLKKAKKLTDKIDISMKIADKASKEAKDISDKRMVELAKLINDQHNGYDYHKKAGLVSKNLASYAGNLKSCQSKLSQLYYKALNIQKEYAIGIIKTAAANSGKIKDADRSASKAAKYTHGSYND